MRRTRLLAAGGALALVTAGVGGAGSAVIANASARGADAGSPGSYVVLAREGASARGVADRLAKLGVTVTGVNTDIGMITVDATGTGFVGEADAVAGVEGVARDRSIGRIPGNRKPDPVESEHKTAPKSGGSSARTAAGDDPYDSYLWGMDMIRADEAHDVTLGDPLVRVGILDTGVDGRHPDLHANFDDALSRNFTTDIESVDGPCEYAGCTDPANVDDNGHGTHVAGTIAAAMNGLGVSGVAPDVTIVNIRGGQDSGYFFLAPVANALTYAGNAGLDAVNMSFYVDPWLFNCRGGAAEDSPAEAAEQDTIIKAMTRALNFAHSRNVTLVGSLGNGHDDLAKPRMDLTSPDYPGGTEHPRTIVDNQCFDLPVEGPHVLGISALGPSGKKADYSNWSTGVHAGEIEFAAPGGWFRDGFGTPTFRVNENLILSAAPREVLIAAGEVDANGDITPLGQALGVKRDCLAAPQPGVDQCGYYQYLQGTSMASPHATGVAALVVSAHGRPSSDGLTMAPGAVEQVLARTAIDHACPPGGIQEYLNEGRDASYTATCKGTTARNGFYGHGIVDALGVVD